VRQAFGGGGLGRGGHRAGAEHRAPLHDRTAGGLVACSGAPLRLLLATGRGRALRLGLGLARRLGRSLLLRRLGLGLGLPPGVGGALGLRPGGSLRLLGRAGRLRRVLLVRLLVRLLVWPRLRALLVWRALRLLVRPR
jgi:hypothetical protein